MTTGDRESYMDERWLLNPSSPEVGKDDLAPHCARLPLHFDRCIVVLFSGCPGAKARPDWAWYGDLVGAYFASHPQIQPASIQVEDREHPSTADLPAIWKRT
ncbi:MAG TPA: ThuA domain-containing protein, partial [Myxococcaceae bacterium]|nr:ThuA domain-containing protein [Myxococcaceae bacterium]